MSRPRYAKISGILHSTTLAATVIVVLHFQISCQDDTKRRVADVGEADSLAIMTTMDAVIEIADSGRTAYKIYADEWKVFEKRRPPYWAMEKGVYLEKFNKELEIEGTIKCDTAYYYTQQKLWKLIGNVNIKNPKNERFYTDLMYWDQEKELIYSDAYIKIEQTEHTTEGVGFSSNQDMTVWEIKNTKGIYAIKENKEEEK